MAIAQKAITKNMKIVPHLTHAGNGEASLAWGVGGSHLLMRLSLAVIEPHNPFLVK